MIDPVQVPLTKVTPLSQLATAKKGQRPFHLHVVEWCGAGARVAKKGRKGTMWHICTARASRAHLPLWPGWKYNRAASGGKPDGITGASHLDLASHLPPPLLCFCHKTLIHIQPASSIAHIYALWVDQWSQMCLYKGGIYCLDLYESINSTVVDITTVEHQGKHTFMKATQTTGIYWAKALCRNL